MRSLMQTRYFQTLVSAVTIPLPREQIRPKSRVSKIVENCIWTWPHSIWIMDWVSIHFSYLRDRQRQQYGIRAIILRSMEVWGPVGGCIPFKFCCWKRKVFSTSAFTFMSPGKPSVTLPSNLVLSYQRRQRLRVAKHIPLHWWRPETFWWTFWQSWQQRIDYFFFFANSSNPHLVYIQYLFWFI